jgi:hypothetical protein
VVGGSTELGGEGFQYLHSTGGDRHPSTLRCSCSGYRSTDT